MNSYCGQRSCSINSNCYYYPCDVRIAIGKEPKSWFVFKRNFDLKVTAMKAVLFEKVVGEEIGVWRATVMLSIIARKVWKSGES
jgi:hypothetical protein